MKKREAGFTMVELIIVIALMTILIIPASRFLDGAVFTQRKNADLLISSLQLAQKTAVAQRRNIYISLNGNTLRLCYQNENPCQNSNSVKQANSSIYEITLAGETIVVPNGTGFTAGGVLINDNTLTINTSNKNITVEQGTGYVH